MFAGFPLTPKMRKASFANELSFFILRDVIDECRKVFNPRPMFFEVEQVNLLSSPPMVLNIIIYIVNSYLLLIKRGYIAFPASSL